MKKICLYALSFSLCFGAVSSLFAMDTAVLDMERVFLEYYKTKIEDAKLKKQADVFKDYMIMLSGDREKLQIEYVELRDASQNIALSDAQRENKRIQSLDKYRELQAKDAEMQRYNQEKQKFLSDEYDRIRRALTLELKEVIKSRAIREGYKLVIDYSGNSMNNISTIIYFDKNMDITERIIKEINLGNEPASAAAIEAGLKRQEWQHF